MKMFVEEDTPSLAIGTPMTAEDILVQRNETILATGSRPRPWSHTALDNFNNCPRQFHEIKVLKHFEDSKGEAAIWGDRVHCAFEEYLKNDTPLDPELESYYPYLEAIKATPGIMYVEYEMALDKSLNPCAMLADGVFVRGICDVLQVEGDFARAIDHKTGKVKPNSRQMMLMALLIFAHFKQVLVIDVAFEWLKFKKTTRDSYKRSDIAKLWSEFLPDLQRYKEAFRTNNFPPRASGLCHGWCPVTSCEFWKPKRVK